MKCLCGASLRVDGPLPTCYRCGTLRTVFVPPPPVVITEAEKVREPYEVQTTACQHCRKPMRVRLNRPRKHCDDRCASAARRARNPYDRRENRRCTGCQRAFFGRKDIVVKLCKRCRKKAAWHANRENAIARMLTKPCDDCHQPHRTYHSTPAPHCRRCRERREKRQIRLNRKKAA